VVGDEKHIVLRELGDVFCTADLQFIDDRNSRVRKYPNNSINNFPDQLVFSKLLPDRHGMQLNDKVKEERRFGNLEI
jgi:hypothetical protein